MDLNHDFILFWGPDHCFGREQLKLQYYSTQWYCTNQIGVERAEIKRLADHIHHEGVDHHVEFYPIIVVADEDLFIMGGGRCVSHDGGDRKVWGLFCNRWFV